MRSVALLLVLFALAVYVRRRRRDPVPAIIRRDDLRPEDDPAHDLDGPDPFANVQADDYPWRVLARGAV